MKIPGYDKQASDYDERVGTGEDIARQVAEGVFALIHKNNMGKVLDVGCGTGEIGQYLSDIAVDYTGMDRSAGMLAEFKARLADKADTTCLLEADGDLLWPVADHSVDLIFSSRALHLLNLGHVLSEMQRIASPSGLSCIIGRVTRDKHGVSQSMRRQMRKLLEAHGFKGRSGKRNLDDIRQHCLDAGAIELTVVRVASWQNAESPLHSLNSWRSKAGLAGIDVPDKIRKTVLDELEQWAIQQYGSIDKTEESDSCYELCSFYFPPKELVTNE